MQAYSRAAQARRHSCEQEPGASTLLPRRPSNQVRRLRRGVSAAPPKVAARSPNEAWSMDLWAYANKVTLEFSRPGKPTDNAFIESFNGSLRDECLNTHWFTDLADAKVKLESWMKDYNESWPHRALNELSPLEFESKWLKETSKVA